MNLNDIIAGCISQNRVSQEQLYTLYKKTLFALSLKYCSNIADAEDNLHNAFLEIFKNIKNFENNGTFEGWIKRITINKAIDSYKKTYLLNPITDDFQDEVFIDEDDFNCTLDDLLLMIQELPNQYRLIFNLYELDDYSHQEIAQMLSIKTSTSKSNLHRAKILLKEKITGKNIFHKNTSNGKQ